MTQLSCTAMGLSRRQIGAPTTWAGAEQVAEVKILGVSGGIEGLRHARIPTAARSSDHQGEHFLDWAIGDDAQTYRESGSVDPPTGKLLIVTQAW